MATKYSRNTAHKIVYIILMFLLVGLLVMSILFATGVFKIQTVNNYNDTNNNTTTNNETTSIPTDSISGNVAVIDTDHYQLHQGRTFHFSELISSLGNGSNQDYYIVSPSGAHLRFWTIHANTGPITITLYENPTISDNGSAQTVQNMSRFSSNTTGLILYKSPTVSNVGTRLEFDILFPSKKDAAGATDDNPLEWILKTTNTYLIRVNNGSGGATDVHFKIQWYHIS